MIIRDRARKPIIGLAASGPIIRRPSARAKSTVGPACEPARFSVGRSPASCTRSKCRRPTDIDSRTLASKADSLESARPARPPDKPPDADDDGDGDDEPLAAGSG